MIIHPFDSIPYYICIFYGGAYNSCILDVFCFHSQALGTDLDKAIQLLALHKKMAVIVSEGRQVLSKAGRDCKTAAMNKCGLWDAVRDSQEILITLHEETLDLLKAKYLLDGQLDAVKEVVRRKRELLLIHTGASLRS